MFKRKMIYENYQPSYNQYMEEDGNAFFTNIYLYFDKEKKCIIVEQVDVYGTADDRYDLEEVIDKKIKKTEINIDP